MNITKEILDWQNISSIIIKKNQIDIMSFLTKSNNEKWTLAFLQKQEFFKNEKITIQLNFINSESEDFTALILESGEDYCDIKIIPETMKRNSFIFYETLIELEEKYLKYGRRKEERMEIGKRNAKIFGLDKPQQTIFVNEIKKQQPCAIVDASIHGICIITPFSDSRLKECDSFNLFLTFENPKQNILLRLHKVHTQLKKTNNKVYAKISCQLLEPIHFAWKDRVINLIKNKTL